MAQANLIAAWIGILSGFIAGAVPGLFFHNPDWLGGYGSWQRRMVRLAHISFFGIGFINLAFALTATHLAVRDEAALLWSSKLLILAAITMPTVCYLSAYRDVFRHLFFVPVMSLLAGVGLFVVKEIFW